MRQLVGIADGAAHRPGDGARSARVAGRAGAAGIGRSAWPAPSSERPTTRWRYAAALADWGDHGGYDAEVHWDECITRAVGLGLDEVADRPLRTFSGGEQKRLALEVLLRGDDDVLLLDEPDNFLDVPAKRWLEGELRGDAQDDPVRQPRPRAAGRRGDAHRHRRGRRHVDPRRRLRRLPEARQARLDKLGEGPIAGTTTSASGSRTSSPRCAGGRRSPTASRPS